MLATACLSLAANLKPTATFLEGSGVDVGAAGDRHPALLSASVERKLAPAVAFLRDEVGIADVGRAASAQPALLSLSVDGNLRPKLAFLRELGMENLGEQLGAYPALLSLSLEQNLRPTAAALIDGGVLAPPDAALRPRHLAASLDARILPRLEYCQLLRELEDVVLRRGTDELGDDLPPLRYRLLPPSAFINIEFYEERVRMRRAGARLFHSSLSRGFNAWLSCADPLDGTRAHFKTSHLRTRNAGTSTSRRGSRRCFAARKRD